MELRKFEEFIKKKKRNKKAFISTQKRTIPQDQHRNKNYHY